MPFSRGFPQPRDFSQHWSPALQADSVPFEPSGKHHLRIHYVNRHIAYRLLNKYRIMPEKIFFGNLENSEARQPPDL